MRISKRKKTKQIKIEIEKIGIFYERKRKLKSKLNMKFKL